MDIDLFGNPINKQLLKDSLGFLPISIWQPNWRISTRLKKIIGDKGQSRFMDERSGNYRTAGKSYLTTLGKADNNMSIFNPCLAQMILSAYCPPKAKIYDPFAGGGTRGFVATAMGHNYTGIELREEEVDRIIKRQKELSIDFLMTVGDATESAPMKSYYDFCFTCPPYYNLEIYSDLPNDLSNMPTYEMFLQAIEQVLLQIYYAIHFSSFCVWVVGNFRDKKGELIHFSGDVIKAGKKAGFSLHDELIFWGASPNSVARCGNFEPNKKSVRVHEYILVFKKK